MDAGPVLDVDPGAKVSPVLETNVVLLIIMTSWRGVYYAMRDGLL
jgi:hypothetical protein